MSMAALMLEGAGALHPTADAEDKPRIRVRLHFGGTFAQDGPRQWRYVGGEVYNESFPLDSKYAEVMKRLNDKFGDTVSFKYLCPGDDIDPDNLVQVQGDDDLREMCDEYQNALQKPSTPVKTVRIKVFVFRAVIFEREVQELDEELGESDEMMDLPDGGLAAEQLSSCDYGECGPNWSDWGEPDEYEATQSSIPSAQFSSDAEQHTSAAAAVAAVAAATAALHNISMSVNSITSGRTHLNGTSTALTSADVTGGAGSKVHIQGLSRTNQPALCAQPKRLSACRTSGEGKGGVTGLTCGSGSGSSGGYVGSASPQYGDSTAAATAAGGAAPANALDLCEEETEFGAESGAYGPLGMGTFSNYLHGEASYGAAAAGAFMDAAEQLGHGDEQLYDKGVEVEDEEAAGEEQAEAGREEGDDRQDRGIWVWAERDLYGFAGQPHRQEQQWPLHEELSGFNNWAGARGEGRDLVQHEWRHDRGLERSRLEQQQMQEQTQESQQIQIQQQEQERKLEQQQTQERQNFNSQHQPRDTPLQPGLGFYCEEELEDPYGETYDDAISAVALSAGLHALNLTARSHSGPATSDGTLRVAQRTADTVAYGEHAAGHNGVYGAGAGGGGAGGLLARLPAAADMLPRHISAFGESSRDESQGGCGGGGGGVAGGSSGPLLPSRITIFGDDESLQGMPGGGGSSSLTGGAAGGGSRPSCGGRFHRLAMLGVYGGAGGGGAAAPATQWPGHHVHSGDTAAAAVKSSAAGLLGPAEDIVAGDSRLCITQEFGMRERSSLSEPEEHGGGMEDTVGNSGSGGGGGLPLGPLDPLSRTGLGLGTCLGGDVLNHLGSGGGHSHPLKEVVKKRKSEVSILAKIGEGAFGEVSQAQVFPYGIVAVKWLKRERFAKYSESFQREAETLAKLNHPNIIRMYGLVMDTPDSPNFATGGTASGGGGGGVWAAPGVPHGVQGASGGGSGGNNNNNNAGGGGGASCSGTPTGLIGGIITEFVRNGSLGQFLRSLNGRRLSLRQRAMIALQAALGMAYLHEQSPAVVHFDLKPDNLLVDGEGDSMVIKVADFGLSKHKLSNYVSCRDLRGTLPYMAYELVSGNGNISEKVDVYSMGVVMWEMYTGEVPFAHLTAQEILTGLLHGNLHLAIPPACEPEWRSLVETCMDPNPANRPSFQELAMQLQEMMRMERQASNASSTSAAVAVLDSDAATALPLAARGGSGDGVVSAVAGPSGAGGGIFGAVAGGLAQWCFGGMPLVPAAVAAGPGMPPQVRSPGAGPPLPQPPPLQVLLARQQQQQQQQVQNSMSPPLQQPHPPQPHPPLLVQLQQQQQHAPPLPPSASPQAQPMKPFQLQQPYANVPFALPPQAMRPLAQPPQQQQPSPPQPPAPPPQSTPQPTPPPPLQQHLHYLQQLTPGLLLQQQQPPPPPPRPAPLQLPPPHLYALPLPPQALFQPPPPPQPHGLNSLYGLAGGVGAGGLPPLVSWGDRCK